MLKQLAEKREHEREVLQKALEENDGRGGIMTAYTRWGTTWSGFNQNLMSGAVRFGRLSACR